MTTLSDTTLFLYPLLQDNCFQRKLFLEHISNTFTYSFIGTDEYSFECVHQHSGTFTLNEGTQTLTLYYNKKTIQLHFTVHKNKVEFGANPYTGVKEECVFFKVY